MTPDTPSLDDRIGQIVSQLRALSRLDRQGARIDEAVAMLAEDAADALEAAQADLRQCQTELTAAEEELVILHNSCGQYEHVLAQLRHLYVQLSQQDGLRDGLLAPQIRRLEAIVAALKAREMDKDLLQCREALTRLHRIVQRDQSDADCVTAIEQALDQLVAGWASVSQAPTATLMCGSGWHVWRGVPWPAVGMPCKCGQVCRDDPAPQEP